MPPSTLQFSSRKDFEGNHLPREDSRRKLVPFPSTNPKAERSLLLRDDKQINKKQQGPLRRVCNTNYREPCSSRKVSRVLPSLH